MTRCPARFSWSAAASPRPRADDGHRPAGAAVGGSADPALVERPLDDGHLDRLDGHRVAVDGEHARALAGGGAEPPRPLGEVVGLVQALARRLPLVAVDEVVPVGDEVAERTPLVAEGDAAVHAPRPLRAQVLVGVRQVDLAPVADSFRHVAARLLLPVDLDESLQLSHDVRVSGLGRPRAGGSETAAVGYGSRSVKVRTCAPCSSTRPFRWSNLLLSRNTPQATSAVIAKLIASESLPNVVPSRGRNPARASPNHRRPTSPSAPLAPNQATGVRAVPRRRLLQITGQK